MTESTAYDVSLSRKQGDKLQTPAANTTLPVLQSATIKGKDTLTIRLPANNNVFSTSLLFRTLSYHESHTSASSAPSQSQFSTNRAKVRSASAQKSPPPPIDVLVANCYMAPGMEKNKEEKEQENNRKGKKRSRTCRFIIGPSPSPSPTEEVAGDGKEESDCDRKRFFIVGRILQVLRKKR
ncbi:hypothetical protein MMC22_006457 [Lobaria immixta]|nr:hypothetical protein [Lobaria immixta]